MSIEEDIKPLKILMSKYKQIDEMNNFDHELALVIDYTELSAIETLLTAYEKEKEENKSIDEFCRKELAFKRRLQRENRQPDEFNQGRFYVSENIRKIIREE